MINAIVSLPNLSPELLYLLLAICLVGACGMFYSAWQQYQREQRTARIIRRRIVEIERQQQDVGA